MPRNMAGRCGNSPSSCSMRDTGATRQRRGFAYRPASWKMASDVQVGRKRGVLDALPKATMASGLPIPSSTPGAGSTARAESTRAP